MEQVFQDQPRYKNDDHQLFGSAFMQDKLRNGLQDMHYLLSRDYPVKAALALVGNRYELNRRQQLALQGMSASVHELQLRKRKEQNAASLPGKTIYLDGFNLLILLETVFSGGYIFKGLDGCYRDIASIHGTYKKINQTADVLLLIGNALRTLRVPQVVWVFDKPVSNSGKMKIFCEEIAAQHAFHWEVLLENAPDTFLAENNRLVCSADGWVLNACDSWFNLGAWILENMVHAALHIVDVTGAV
jgi:hypothetical protein